MRVNCPQLRWLECPKVPDCFRISMYRAHWKAYIDEGNGERKKTNFGPPNMSYLGFPCLMATIVVMVSMSVFLLPPKLVASRWWQVVFYWGLLPRSIRSRMLVLFLCYSLLAALGSAYEMLYPKRAVQFMRLFGPVGEQALTIEQKDSFKRFMRRTLRIIHLATWSYFTFAVCSFFGSALMSGAWEFNRPWLIFWLIFWVAYFPSSYYVSLAVPGLLFIVVHYLRLRQKRLEIITKWMISTRVLSNLVSSTYSFERLVGQYVDLNRELGRMNRFWAFYIWLYLNILPSMVVYGLHKILTMQEFFWIGLTIVAASFYTIQLALIVYLCGSVRKGNQRITQHLAGFWRGRFEAQLSTNITRLLHLESMVHNLVLTDYSFRMINHQVIGTSTYISLIIKFVFVFIKFVSNKNFNPLERQLTV